MGDEQLQQLQLELENVTHLSKGPESVLLIIILLAYAMQKNMSII
jgi:hypothetical protein